MVAINTREMCEHIISSFICYQFSHMMDVLLLQHEAPLLASGSPTEVTHSTFSSPYKIISSMFAARLVAAVCLIIVEIQLLVHLLYV